MNRTVSPRLTLGVMAAGLFCSYLGVALPLSILSVYVTGDWGLSGVLGGLAVGSAFVTTILTRKYSGAMADRLGGKVCFSRGALCYGAGNFLCIAAAVDALPFMVRFGFLFMGRLILGLGEGMVNTGMVAWGVDLIGPEKTGRWMATVGMAMYGAIACGGPIGYWLFRQYGFASVMALGGVIPLLAVILVRPLADEHQPAPPDMVQRSFLAVVGTIWRQCLGLFFYGFGFAVIGAFLSTVFIANGWPLAGYGLASFGIGFVVMRLFIGHLPDKLGGYRVALVSFAVEVTGLGLLWLASGPALALAGAFLTGCGSSMVYPSLGREVVMATPPLERGVAIGCYAAFQDLAYGAVGPVAGIFADRYGGQSVFLFACLAALAGLAVTLQTVLSQRAYRPAAQ